MEFELDKMSENSSPGWSPPGELTPLHEDDEEIEAVFPTDLVDARHFSRTDLMDVQVPMVPQLNRPFSKIDSPIQEYGENPFANDAVCMCSEWIRCIVVGVTIFPIRLAVLLLSCVLGWLFVTIAGLGFEKSMSSSFQKVHIVRTHLLLPVRLCARGILFSFGFWWISVDKDDPDADAPVIVVASHCSIFDIIYFIYAWQPMFVCDVAVKDVPVIGKCAHLMEAVFVDRDDETSRREALIAIDQVLTEEGSSSAKINRRVLFFPEGTWTNGRRLVSFKTGAFSLGLPVLPVGLKYPHEYLNVSGVGRAGGCCFLFRMMMQVYNSMQIMQLPVYHPTEEEISDPPDFGRNVRAILAAKLNVSTTEHTYEDAWLMADIADDYSAGQKLRNAAETFDVSSVQKHCDVSFEHLSKLLRSFRALNLDDTGCLNYEGFIAATGMDEGKYSLNLFGFLDMNHQLPNSNVRFIDFVQSLSVLTNRRAFRHQLQLAYLTCNTSGSCKLTLGEYEEAVQQIKLPRTVQDRSVESMRQILHEQMQPAQHSRSHADELISLNQFQAVMDQNRSVLSALNEISWQWLQKLLAPKNSRD